MIKSFTVTNYLGDSIKLILGEPERSGFLIHNVDGLGPAKANVNTTNLTAYDGSVYNSARLDERNIVLDILFTDSLNHESIEDLRQKSYKYFPLKRKLELLIETDNRLLRTTGYVESNEPNIFSKQEGTKISIICPDPYLYSAGPKGVNVTDFYTIEPMFEFPFSNESLTEPLLEFGDIRLITDGVVIYTGDADIGMTIHIHAIGKVVNPTIYNIQTRETITIDTTKLETLTGSGIIAGDNIVITTMKGEKSITLLRGGETYNILICIGKNYDWFSLTKGDNLFAFTAELGITKLQLKIENRIIYEGV